jgi:hypothetical protein
VGEGEGDAFRAGGDDINTLATVVGKGWAKGKSAMCRGVRHRRRQDKVDQFRRVDRSSGKSAWVEDRMEMT